jgi:glycosyltransferase involved in cell wall biosynthesis
MHKALSIIIATHNCDERIVDTLASICSIEEIDKVEVILKDDGTSKNILKIAERFKKEIFLRVIISPDRGVYEAWNQALEYTNGEYILFLGDDDKIICKDVVSLVDREVAKILYGKIVKVKGVNGKSCILGKPWFKLRWEFATINNFPHQATFHRLDLFDEKKFDTNYKIASDYEFLNWAINKYGDPKYIDSIVTRMEFGGLSTQYKNRFKIMREFKSVQRKYKIKNSKLLLIKYYLGSALRLVLEILILKKSAYQT